LERLGGFWKDYLSQLKDRKTFTTQRQQSVKRVFCQAEGDIMPLNGFNPMGQGKYYALLLG
jgi:hypothetical protein